MKYGIWTPLPNTVRMEPPMVSAIEAMQKRLGGVDTAFRFAVDVVRHAESCGFDITLVAERHLGPDLEAWVLSSALAACTSRIEIMTAVHPGIFNPQVVAKMGATLDRLSGGRFAVNVVPGRMQKEFEIYGNGAWLDEADGRYRRLSEFIQVMKGLWTADQYSLDGEFFRVVDGCLPTKTMRLPHPPIYAASGSERGKDIIATECDVWFASYKPGLCNFDENFLHLAREIASMKARAKAYGRDIACGISAHVVCTPTEDEAARRAGDLEAYGQGGTAAGVAAKGLGVGLVGTAQRIAERIKAYQDIGMDCLMLHFHPMIDGISCFASEVMPLVAAGEVPRHT
jgi:FMNH2-dependent dimethyl sulfone monooxygenase